MRVIVGARRSKLAQQMVREFLDRLSGCPVVEFGNRVVTTAGDQDRTSALSQLGSGGRPSPTIQRTAQLQR